MRDGDSTWADIPSSPPVNAVGETPELTLPPLVGVAAAALTLTLAVSGAAMSRKTHTTTRQ